MARRKPNSQLPAVWLLLWLLALWLAFPSPCLFAQFTPTVPLQFVTADPAGACTLNAPMRYNTSNGKLWGCDALTWTQIGSGGGSGSGISYCAPSSSSGTAYTCAPSPALTSYAAGATLGFVPDVNGTPGAVTVNVNSLGAKSIKESDGSTNPLAGDLVAGLSYALVYDGTVFRITPAATVINGVKCIPGSTCSITAAGAALTITNEGVTGTTLNTLSQITSSQTAIVAPVTATSGVVGVCTSGCATTGSATITTSGSVSCVFDTAITSGDYVQISNITAGNCRDAGANPPNTTTGQSIGRVLSATNASAGTYTIDLFPSEIQSSTPLQSPYALAGHYAALANLPNATEVILGIGDSIMTGTGAASNTTQKGWFPLLKIRNQSTFTDRGDGWQYFPGAAQSCGVWTATVNSPLCQWTTTGVWTVVTGWGPSGSKPGALLSGSSGATGTLSNAKFTGIDIFYATDTGTASGCSYNIDGAGAVTFGNTTTGSRTWAHTGTVSVSLGVHSTVITAIGAGSCEILGVELLQSGTGGILFNNIALSGTSTTGWAGTGASQTLTSAFGWVAFLSTPNLIIEALGTNDYSSIAPATFKTQLNTILASLQSSFPTASMLLVSPQNQSAAGLGSASMQQYYQAKRQLASQYGAAYVNIGDRWGSWANANTLGLMAAGGTGTLHPGTLGHWDWSEAIISRHDQYTGLFPNPYFPSQSQQGNQITNSQAYACRSGDPAPTIALGAAANSTTAISATSGPSPTGASCDFGGTVQINTTCSSCVAGTASQPFFTVTYGTTKTNVLDCVLTPSGAQSAALSGTSVVYYNKQNSSTTVAAFYAGSVLPPNGQFMWYTWHCAGQ